MTLSISDINQSGRSVFKTGYVYLLVSLVCAVFGAVYEHFSHGVYSGYMAYAFLFPLAGGALPFLTMFLLSPRQIPGRLSRNLYHSGIAALTVGSMVRGALDIYGTASGLCRVYRIAGAVFAGLGILSYLFRILSSHSAVKSL